MLWDIQALAATSTIRGSRGGTSAAGDSSLSNPVEGGASVSGSGGGWTKASGITNSVYSIATDANGTLVAAGTSDGCVWLVDARSGRAEAHLRGHSSTVRALCMRPDGSALLSGSADHTIRAWDLRQRRAFTTLAVHTDSVWALAPTDSGLETVYSGGRDGCVYRTHVASKVTQLVAEETRPVTALAPVPGSDAVWVATTSSTLRCWNVATDAALDSLDAHQYSAGSLPSSGLSPVGSYPTSPIRNSSVGSSFVAGSLPAVRARTTFQGGATKPPLSPSSTVAAIIPGVPPVRHVAVLTNRRHILTQDSENNVQLWDLSIGAPVPCDLGNVPLQEAERQLFDPAHNVWPWFQADTRLGCLAGVMEPPGCFLAEAYRRDLGDTSAPADAKINMAQHMVGALFATWAERRQNSAGAGVGRADIEGEGVSGGGGGGGGDVAMMDVTSTSTPIGADEGSFRVDAAAVGGGSTLGSPGSPVYGSSGTGPWADAFHLQCELPPVVMVSGGNGVAPWRRSIDAFDGSEPEGEMIPQWVADCVLRKKIPTGKDLKMAFILVPAPKSGLPSLLQSKLNAPRVLGIDKVADYVMRKMADQGFALSEEPLFWSPEKQALWEDEQRRGGGHDHDESAMHSSGGVQGGSPSSARATDTGNEASSGPLGLLGIRQLRPVAAAAPPQPTAQPLLITCCGAAVPWDFTLAAVRQWMWKRPEDLRLEYSVREPGSEVRIPVIRPPTG